MRRIAVLALSVGLLGVWGCGGKPELTMQQKKTVEYLEALADQKDREAAMTEGLAKEQMIQAGKLREEALNYRRKAKSITSGQDIDETEHDMEWYRR